MARPAIDRQSTWPFSQRLEILVMNQNLGRRHALGDGMLKQHSAKGGELGL